MFCVVVASAGAADMWSGTVRGLFDPKTRDATFTRIAEADSREPGAPEGKTEAKPVKDVVVCPEPDGPPMIAVFLKSSYDKANAPSRSGHFVLLNGEGKFLPVFQNANSLDARDVFEDINGDGVIDCVMTFNSMFEGGFLKRLTVLPMVREQVPSLTVLFKSSGFTWRLKKTDGAPGEIEIGRTKGKSFTPVVTYKWSKAAARWEGPDGGDGAAFARVHDLAYMNAAAAKVLALPDSVRPARKNEMAAPKFPDDFKMLGRNDGKLQTDLGAANYIDVDAKKDDMNLGLRLFQPPLLVWKLKSEKAMLDGARDSILAGPEGLVLEKETNITLDGLPGRSFLFFDKAKGTLHRSDYILDYPDIFIFSYDGPRTGLELLSVKSYFESIKTMRPAEGKPAK